MAGKASSAAMNGSDFDLLTTNRMVDWCNGMMTGQINDADNHALREGLASAMSNMFLDAAFVEPSRTCFARGTSCGLVPWVSYGKILVVSDRILTPHWTNKVPAPGVRLSTRNRPNSSVLVWVSI